MPAYSVVGVEGSTTRDHTILFVKPLLAAAQLAPPLVLLNTPPPGEPTYTVEGATGSMASGHAKAPPSPLPAKDQLAPPSVLLATPSAPRLAYSVVGVVGWMASPRTRVPASPAGCHALAAQAVERPRACKSRPRASSQRSSHGAANFTCFLPSALARCAVAAVLIFLRFVNHRSIEANQV